MGTIKVILIGMVLVSGSFAQAFEPWWQCKGKLGGEWNFARSPSICLVDHMQDQSFVRRQYDDIIFDDSVIRGEERVRYMTELNALAADVAHFYLQRRKPSAGSAEHEAFYQGLLALMHQETFWSHYRKGTDDSIRYMRGDEGHGHGIMQVDDRSHQTALLQGRGADLIYNMIYGLDVFFEEWERAPVQSCVSSATNYVSRTRSAWSAYNGGPGSICRWTNPNSVHASKDIAFFDKFKKKSWRNYIDDMNHISRFDIQCLAEGKRPCASLDESSPTDDPQEGELYKNSLGQHCIVKDRIFQCVNLLDDVNCLQLRENRIFDFVKSLSKTGEQKLPKTSLDRHNLCLNNTTGLIPVTANLKIHKNINLRRTPDGELLTTLKSGEEFKSLDFRVTTTKDQKRYYRVKSGTIDGYLYAGSAVDYGQWVSEMEVPFPDPVVASAGSFIQVVAPSGINMRRTPGGAFVSLVPNGNVREVISVRTSGSENYLYYEIEHAGRRGFIYSGFLSDLTSVPSWTVPVVQSVTWSQLVPAVPFRFLRQCAGDSCAFRMNAIRSTALLGRVDQVRVVDVQGEWSLVESRDLQKKGWILTVELEQGSKQ